MRMLEYKDADVAYNAATMPPRGGVKHSSCMRVMGLLFDYHHRQ